MSQVLASEAGSGPSPDTESPISQTPAAASPPAEPASDPEAVREAQTRALEHLSAGRNLVVQAHGGVANGAIFGPALVDRIAGGAAAAGHPGALVLVPTRELAHRLAIELRALGAQKGVRVLAIYGGVSMGRQTAAIRAGVDIVVATAGRLLDHLRRENLSLDQARWVVVDEADELVAMDAWPSVTSLVGMTAPERQTIVLSATWPSAVAASLHEIAPNCVRLQVSSTALRTDGVEHFVCRASGDVSAFERLHFLLETERPGCALIFCDTAEQAQAVATYLSEQGYAAEALRPKLRRREREELAVRLRRGDLSAAVATDTAVRGLDLSAVTHVINYALPAAHEVYVHRVGHVGNPSCKAVALSLIESEGPSAVEALQAALSISLQEKALASREQAMRRRSERIMKELSDKAATSDVGAHLGVAQEILQSTGAAQVVAFLLKTYYGRPAPTELAATSRVPREGAVETGTSDDGRDDGLRRRRRRRRRGPRDRMGSEPHLEVVDARDMLTDNPSAAGAPDVGAEGPLADAAAGNGSSGAKAPSDGMTRLRVNIGFDDGFKSRGAVAKKISALAGLNEGILIEIESRRDYAVLKVPPEIAEMVIDRVDGAQIGKKTLTVNVAS